MGGLPWSEDDDEKLLRLYEQRKSRAVIAQAVGRSPYAVRRRLWELRRRELARKLPTMVRTGTDPFIAAIIERADQDGIDIDDLCQQAGVVKSRVYDYKSRGRAAHIQDVMALLGVLGYTLQVVPKEEAVNDAHAIPERRIRAIAKAG